MYEHPETLSEIQGDFQIGFDSGDGVRGLVLLGTSPTENTLESVNIYRIDGKQFKAQAIASYLLIKARKLSFFFLHHNPEEEIPKPSF